jgi:hypothetical protein
MQTCEPLLNQYVFVFNMFWRLEISMKKKAFGLMYVIFLAPRLVHAIYSKIARRKTELRRIYKLRVSG